MSEQPSPNFGILKLVVAILGIAILVMTGIIIFKSVQKFSGAGDDAGTATTAAASPSGQPWRVGMGDIGGGKILSGQTDGGVLTLLIEASSGLRWVELRDAATGRLLGQVGAKPLP